MIARSDIVAALATVPGLEPSATTPDAIDAGSAWPVWASTTWLDMNLTATETRWYVFVALANASGGTTVDAGDPLVQLVADALAAIGLGGLTAEPWQWLLEPGGAGIPVLRVTAVD